MTKIELLSFVAEAQAAITSADLSDAFAITPDAAAVYLRRAHGSGLLRRWKLGRGFIYVLAAKGVARLRYEAERAAVLDEDYEDVDDAEPEDAFDKLDDVDGDHAPGLAFAWCAACRRGFHVQRDRLGLVACRCGCDLVEVDERA